MPLDPNTQHDLETRLGRLYSLLAENDLDTVTGAAIAILDKFAQQQNPKAGRPVPLRPGELLRWGWRDHWRADGTVYAGYFLDDKETSVFGGDATNKEARDKWSALHTVFVNLVELAVDGELAAMTELGPSIRRYFRLSGSVVPFDFPRMIPAPAGGAPRPRSDGPEPPHWLWRNGERLQIGKGRSKLSWLLLKFFWQRNSSDYEDLQGTEKPWTDPVNDSAVATAVTRFNLDMPEGFPWRLRTKNRTVYKEFHENPSQ